MQLIRIVNVAAMAQGEQASAMRTLLTPILALPADQPTQMLSDRLLVMGEYANDDPYRNLCRTSLTIATALPQETLQPCLAAPMAAQTVCPSDLAAHDQTMIEQALQSLPVDIEAKIKENLSPA